MSMPHPVSAGKVKAAAQRDVLTGLWTQDSFIHRLDHCLRQGRQLQQAITLALLQLENFYEIRRWVGATEADLLLSDIAAHLNKLVPARTVICRCHNKEFALLLIGDHSRRASLIAEQIRQRARQLAGHSIPPQLNLQCRIGLATASDLTPRAAVLFARARHNLVQQSKQQRRLSPEDPLFGMEPTEVLALLQQALSANTLRLAYQAVVAPQSPGTDHYELRLRLPYRNDLLSAGQFMDIATQFAQGESLDRWVLDQALALLASRRNSHWQLTVNLCQNSLVSREFLAWLQKRLQNRGDLSARLVLQIGEIDLLIAQHHMPDFSAAIQAMGLRICVNHFGSTPDPLRYLSLLQLDTVCLDSTLVEQAAVDSGARNKLSELLQDLGKSQVKVMVSQLEDIRVALWLWQCGVRIFQGNAIHENALAPDYHFPVRLRV